MEKSQENKKESILIVVVGVEEVGRQFLFEAICRIISMSGYSVNAKPFEEKEETDFHIVIGEKFDSLIEKESKLVFASYSDPEDLYPDYVYGGAHQLKVRTKKRYEMIQSALYELVKWMRSSKLAYTMDYDAEYNRTGLHNYTNLRNIILPLNFAFQRIGMSFDKMKPTDLIEALVPELKEKSQEAKSKFEQVIAEAAENKKKDGE